MNVFQDYAITISVIVVLFVIGWILTMLEGKTEGIAKGWPAAIEEQALSEPNALKLSSLSFTHWSASLQKRFDVLAERRFHVSFRLLETTRLNRDGWVFAAAVPAIISQPKLAFDTEVADKTC